MDSLFDFYIMSNEGALKSYCRRYCKNRSDAEDVYQIALVKMHQQFHKFDTTRPFLPWAKTIVHRAAIDYIRKMHKQGVVYNSEGLTEVPHYDNYPALDVNAISQFLTDDMRYVFNLHFLNGLTQKELSKRCGWTQRQTERKVKQTRKKLQEIIHELD